MEEEFSKKHHLMGKKEESERLCLSFSLFVKQRKQAAAGRLRRGALTADVGT